MKKTLCLLTLLLSGQAFAGKTVCESHYWTTSDWNPDLLYQLSPLPGHKVRVNITRPSRLIIQGHIDFRQLYTGGSTGIGVAVWIKNPPPPSNPTGATGFQQIHGSETGEDTTNSGSDPYYSAQIHAYVARLEPGIHDIQVMGRAYGDENEMMALYGRIEVDGLAEMKSYGNYNQVLYQIEDLDGNNLDEPATCSTF